MRKRRRADYMGCSLSSHYGKLRLAWRAIDPAHPGRRRWRSWPTGEQDTLANREKWQPVRRAVAALLAQGVDPLPHLERTTPNRGGRSRAPTVPAGGKTLRDFYAEWIETKVAEARPALLNDYRRHLGSYVLADPIADIALARLRPMDMRLFQARLRQRTSRRTGERLSEHTVRDVIGGSLRAMIRDALVQEELTRDPFIGITFKKITIPPADPLTFEEWDLVDAWFRTQTFQRHLRWRPHPAFRGFVFFQRWHGTRPSEAAGLSWEDVDLAHGVAYIRHSFHYREVCEPKTHAARRTIELHPGMVDVLRTLRPLRPEPGEPVFPNLDGRRITPRVFWDTWKRCLQSCRIRHRGLYALKDTFVTHTLARADEEPGRRDELIAFCVRQTGVREDTLREHYERWWPRDREKVRATYALLDRGLENCSRPATIRGEKAPS